MRKLISILIIALPLLMQAQTYKPYSGNWHPLGYWYFEDGKFKIGTKSITQSIIDGWNATKTKVDGAVSADTYYVSKADSNYQKPGSYTTRYDFRNEQRPDPYLQQLIANGWAVKIAPVGILIPVSGAVVTDGRCHTSLVQVQDSTVFTGAKYFLSTQGNMTADAWNGICLYKWNGSSSSWDLVAQTANTGTIWTGSANVMQTIAFTATYTAAPGWYMIGAYYNNSAQTAAPVMYSISGTNLPFNNYGTRKIGGYIASAGGTPLSNITEASLTQFTSPFLIFLY